MFLVLARRGPELVRDPRPLVGWLYTVAGQVAMVKLPGAMERVEIQWVVSDSRGERGRIVQLNEIKAGLLDRNWGDVAVVVAEEAGAGVKDLVARLVGNTSK